MSDFDPGKGWREVDLDEAPFADYLYLNKDGRDRFWVREVPGPPLPTKRYTIILLHGDQSTEGRVWVLCPGDPVDLWFESGWKIGSTAAELHSALDITGFEVLSEPRAVTAKAVLERIRGFYDEMNPPWVGFATTAETVAREFGVSS